MKAILAIARTEILRNWKLIAVPLSVALCALALAATEPGLGVKPLTEALGEAVIDVR